MQNIDKQSLFIGQTYNIIRGDLKINNLNNQIVSALQRKPTAIAYIRGSEFAPNISGTVSFYQTFSGVLVSAYICGLPENSEICGQHIFAMHIHEGGECTGTAEDPFANAGTHYNPSKCPHPEHAGDLPPLFSNKGCAWYTVLFDRIKIKNIIGKTVIIHDKPDDFTTQPSGNSGKKIACGVINKF